MVFVSARKLCLVWALSVAFCCCLNTSAHAAAAVSGAQTLRPQDVVDAVLKRSFEAEVIALNAQDAVVEYEQVLGRFDFTLSSSVGYEYREAEAVSGFNNLIDRTLSANMTLRKMTKVGAQLEVGYSHEAHRSILNAISSQLRPPTVAFDTAYLELRQKLWSNPFGLSDRLDVTVVREKVKAADLLKQEATEDLVLKSLKSYWDVFVAQTQLQDAIAAREHYKSLVEVVQKRGRFGLDKGGEFAQVMADFTDSENMVKSFSYEYLNKLSSLELLLQVKFSGDVQFEVGELVPTLPKFEAIKTDELRKLRQAEINFNNAKTAEESVGWRNTPTLDLVARAASTGMDERASAAYSEFLSGNKPTYYVGLEVSSPLDSSAFRAARAKARVEMEKKQTALKIAQAESARNLSILEQKLAQTFSVANGSIEAEKYRSRTVKEQEAEYRQGRMPLRELLQTYRLYLDSQSKKVRAIGDYHIALNELAAERDELVR